VYDAAVKVRGLSKQYRIGRRRQKYKTLRETVAGLARAPFRPRAGGSEVPTVWALKGVSFVIPRGEVVGIIGRNGSGKSTLLKILSRITEPTEGSAEIRGRVGSLLEVGTGFHSELTGRENVYLNGAILGMKRNEVDRKFDEIVAFSEVEKFVDTPVKHYSSGMYLRLAFAVAAHLEPDILIVDEVLAVGDAGFQKKCLNKMQHAGQQGRTVLFVSHNMPAITRLCERAILLNEGRILRDGPAPEVVSDYLSSGLGTKAAREWPESAPCPGHEAAGLRAVRIRVEDGRISDTVDIRRPFRIEMEYEVWKAGCKLMPYFSLSNEEGVTAFSSSDPDPVWQGRPRAIGRYVSTVCIPGNFLAEGTMFVAAGMTALDPAAKQFFVRDAVAFRAIDGLDPSSVRGHVTKHMGGVVRPLLQWNTDFKPLEGAPALEARP
jgi:lipopolysaccharide transport system ATP-binding protein